MSIEVLLQSIYYETDLIVAYLWFNGRDASFLKNDEFCSLLIDFCVSAGCHLLVECLCVATSWMPVRCYFLKDECLSSSSHRHLRRDEKMPVRLLVECPCVATGARVFSLVMWVEVSHGLRFYCLLVECPCVATGARVTIHNNFVWHTHHTSTTNRKKLPVKYLISRIAKV
jgi:hypothetical protein